MSMLEQYKPRLSGHSIRQRFCFTVVWKEKIRQCFQFCCRIIYYESRRKPGNNETEWGNLCWNWMGDFMLKLNEALYAETEWDTLCWNWMRHFMLKLNEALYAATEWGTLCWNWMRHFMLKLNETLYAETEWGTLCWNWMRHFMLLVYNLNKLDESPALSVKVQTLLQRAANKSIWK